MPVFMLPGPPGSCRFCMVVHAPTEPHNQQSLPYQMRFKAIHGRDPTWADAIAHCPPVTRGLWKDELKRRGAWSAPADGKVISEFSEKVSDGSPIMLPGLKPQIFNKIRKKTKKKGTA